MNCLSITKVINMDIEVASDDEFTSGGGGVGKKR